MRSPLAIVLDSESDVRNAIAGALRSSGFDVVVAATPQEALDAFRSRSVAVAVLGIASGVQALCDLVERAQRLSPTAVVGVVDGEGDRRALDALRAGAFDVLPRPPGIERVAAFAVRALKQHRLLEELQRLRGEEALVDGGERIEGRSALAEQLRGVLKRLAASRAPVLFHGEPGSGRSHAARCLHALSGRGEPFVPLDAAEEGSRAEARLFGEPPAAGARVAPAALTTPGDVFVASVDALSWHAQGALGEALASGRSAARLLASTALDPEVAVRDGRLHPRLAAAFEGAVVAVAPLGRRSEDVAVLARTFVDALRRLNGLPPIALSPDALAALEGYGWPGNVRELRNAVETAVILAIDGTVRAKDLPAFVHGGAGPADPGVRADRRFRTAKRSVVDAFERSYLLDLLRRHGGNVTSAAEHSGMLRSALQRLLRKHDLRSASFRDDARQEVGGT